MPQVFKIGSCWIYFWANENDDTRSCCVGNAERQCHKNLDHEGGQMPLVQQ